MRNRLTIKWPDRNGADFVKRTRCYAVVPIHTNVLIFVYYLRQRRQSYVIPGVYLSLCLLVC